MDIDPDAGIEKSVKRSILAGWRRALAPTALLVVGLGAGDLSQAQTPSAPVVTGRSQLTDWANVIARQDLAQRAKTVAAINTQAQAQARQVWARKTVLDLIGGFPARTPLNAKSYGVVADDGFSVEKVMYDSQPGYHVPANLYIPAGKGPFPAVIISPGHAPTGKESERTIAALLARAGVMAMAYDVVSEGERLQYYDPAKKASRVGSATAEHSMEFWQVQPVGGHVSSDFVWDAMRGLDYLSSRKDVDAKRLGAFGCSGGGTITAYLAALDDRVKAAGTACYITDFDKLFDQQGPQDAEQSIPGFISSGLDLADWVEMAAPKPYAIISTTEDMFPFAGAKVSHDEAARIYGLYGAQDHLTWITGPGPHGALTPLYPDIVAFFTKWLNNDPTRRPTAPVPRADPAKLNLTPTGQLADSIGGASLQSLNALRADKLAAPPPKVGTPAQLAALRSRLKTQIPAMIKTSLRPGGAPPAVQVVSSETSAGLTVQTLRFKMANGLATGAMLALPEGPGPHGAVLLLSKDEPGAALADQAAALAKTGKVVLALTATGSGGTDAMKGPLLGDWNLLSLRLLLIGKTPLGLRVDDAIQAMDWLSARSDVDPRAISAYGLGLMGPAALHLAILDDRVAAVATDGSLLDYRLAVDSPMQSLLPEVLPQGVLQQYDLGDLILAAAPRPVTVVNPVDAMGAPVDANQFNAAMAYVQKADQALGAPSRVKIAQRATGQPLISP